MTYVAVLDSDGTLIATSSNWRDMRGPAFFGAGCAIGGNYLECCDDSAGAESDATRAAAGLRAVCQGSRSTFRMDYQWVSPSGTLWFDLRFTSFAGDRLSGVTVTVLDVTDETRAERALRESEGIFRETFERAAVGIAHVSTTGRFLRVNDALCQIVGYTRDELLDMTFSALVNPGDGDVSCAELRELFEGRRVAYTTEKRYRRQNGEVVWVSLVATLQGGGPGESRYAIAVLEDITARKATEVEAQRLTHQIEQERARLVEAQSVAKIGSWETDLATMNVIWSAETYRIFQVDPQTFLPTHQEFLQRVHPDDRTAVEQAFAASLTARDPQSIEHRIMTLDGSVKYVTERWRTFDGGAGQAVRAIGTCQDTTEQRIAADTLREQASLLDKAQDAIVVRDLDHRITFWNRSAERMYGWTSDEVMGRSIEELLYADLSDFGAAMEIVMETGEWSGEISQQTRNGRTITVEAHWTLVRNARGLPSVLAINTDITQRRHLEQQYLQAQRLESIGTLAGGIAHDINNILTPILLSIGTLRVDERDPARIEILNTIEDSATRGADMVGRVLSFARGLEGRRVDVRVELIADDVVRIAQETFPRNIRIDLRMPPGLWSLSADPTQLHQVLLNLCVNARDAMPDGGLITISAENATLDAELAALHLDAQEGPYVKIEVRDTGTGIPKTIADKVFDPFFTTKAIGQGTGLGLSTSLAIVKSHGGFIRASSEPGMGARFVVWLPARPSVSLRVEPPAAPPVPIHSGRGELVLVVDDEPAVRYLTGRTLESFGYGVLLAEDGAEAISRYVEHRRSIALVLTDMMMPGMDGLATIQALRLMNPQVRILAASGITEGPLVDQARNEGVMQFLTKPYTAKTLLAAVQQALDGQF